MIKFESNNTYIRSVYQNKDKVDMSLDKKISEMLNSITTKTKQDVCDSKPYGNVIVAIRNNSSDLYCKSYSISVEPNSTDNTRHFLTLNILDPTMQYQLSRTLSAGNKDQIIDFLENGEAEKVIKENLIEMSEKLKRR